MGRGSPSPDARPSNRTWSTVKRLHWPSWMPVDPYILLLLGTVGFAALLPARGAAADVASGASTAAIAFLFFFYGARLSTREALDGLKHWRLHVTVLACTFLIFPLLGLAARGLVPVFLTHPLYQGLLFLTLVPSTIQSSIAFTSIARGNVPAAICAGSFSSLVGIVVTPARGGPARQQWRWFLRGLAGRDRGPVARAVRRGTAAAPLDRRVRRAAQEGARARRPRLDPAGRLHGVQ